MAELDVEEIMVSGVEPTYNAAAAGGDEFINDGRTFLHVLNGSGVSVNVTISSQYPSPPVGTAQDDEVVAVPAGEGRMIGPFPKYSFNDGDDKVQVGYSAVSSVNVAVMKI